MLGWMVIIEQNEKRLANWEVGVFGNDWIEALINNNQAKVVKLNGGYPNTYEIFSADTILTFLKNQQPILPTNQTDIPIFSEDDNGSLLPKVGGYWVDRVSFDIDAINNCDEKASLTVELWDLS